MPETPEEKAGLEEARKLLANIASEVEKTANTVDIAAKTIELFCRERNLDFIVSVASKPEEGGYAALRVDAGASMVGQFIGILKQMMETDPGASRKSTPT